MHYLSAHAAKTMEQVLDLRLKELIYGGDAFDRDDDAADAEFYSVDRFVSHLDDTARLTVERLVASLVVEERPVILDLMASWDSHIPSQVDPSRVVGLGLNRRELERNQALSEVVIHDLNRDPELPFPDCSFDAVLNTVSVEYLTDPFTVFREVGRVLRPGGMFLVTFSDRMFPEKAVKAWRLASEQERIIMVEDFFADGLVFERPRVWISKGLPRPANDRHAEVAEMSDPVVAVVAVRAGGPDLERPFPSSPVRSLFGPEEVAARSRQVATTLRCPHCDEAMNRWDIPQTPYAATETDHIYVCPNNQCPYVIRGWQTMSAQRMPGSSYRLMYDPARDRCGPIPITSLNDLREP